MSHKAEAGIGTLILFIALILVAAIASMVYIQTSNSLQSKALATGSKTQAQVSSGVTILQAWGEDGSIIGTIDRIYLIVRLTPGSEPLTLNESYISFAKPDARQTFRFNSTGDCNNIVDVQNAGQTNTFLVTRLVGYNTAGYLLDGDVVKVCFTNQVCMVSEKIPITVSFVPKVGSIASFSTVTPDVMTQAKVPLFPN